ncbi:NACHT, LRR and PYD domains-containing protein 12-like [Strongylocentrotus purpuratus]|uniref:NACHT domain-containing protein n=1 Tax=Strongylocentrotus purpuratus TaxID=7668 RepID=A0A7M7P029_STRPU|nr:NACHT, LRR and PYD domains-containing protein 12-like [Strongylocentrotus purpuratus]
MKWNVKQQPLHSNRRQLLADALRENDLGGLSHRLLNEPVIPNSTGGPSRLLESQTKPPSAESQTKPLSPKLVELCANDFKFKYRSTLCKIRADPLNPASTVQFDDMFTNLVLLEEHGTDKQMLDYNDILDLKVNGKFPKRIMVQGEAGAGKTTFCAKIAWDWVEGKHFSHFVWVLIVPLREFKQHTIGEIAKSYLAKNNPATVSQITEYIRSNPDKVFIAFDGLDEVSGKIMKTKSCESQPTDQMQLQPSQPSVTSSEACGSSSETGGIGLGDILCSDQLASCPVLVTTRPWRAVEIRSDSDLMKLYTFIYVEGFNRENLSVYIHKYFPKNDDRANQLIQFTSENDVISENMAHYPIYVALLCLELSFIVDVAFESQDPDAAALVKDRVSSKEITLNVSRDMTAHTVAGCAFIRPHLF